MAMITVDGLRLALGADVSLLPRVASIHKSRLRAYETVRGRGSDRDQKRSDPVVFGVALSGGRASSDPSFPRR